MTIATYIDGIAAEYKCYNLKYWYSFKKCPDAYKLDKCSKCKYCKVTLSAPDYTRILNKSRR